MTSVVAWMCLVCSAAKTIEQLICDHLWFLCLKPYVTSGWGSAGLSSSSHPDCGGGGEGNHSCLEPPRMGFGVRASLNAAITVCGHWAVIFIKKAGRCHESNWRTGSFELITAGAVPAQLNVFLRWHLFALVVTREHIPLTMMQRQPNNEAAHRLIHL